MRVKLGGPVDFMTMVEATALASPDATVEGPLLRRMPDEEAADLILQLKDAGELGRLCWAGLQVICGLWAGRQLRHAEEDAVPPAVIPLDITTAINRLRVAIPFGSTRAGLEVRLAPLRRSKAS